MQRRVGLKKISRTGQNFSKKMGLWIVNKDDKDKWSVVRK